MPISPCGTGAPACEKLLGLLRQKQLRFFTGGVQPLFKFRQKLAEFFSGDFPRICGANLNTPETAHTFGVICQYRFIKADGSPWAIFRAKPAVRAIFRRDDQPKGRRRPAR